MRGWELRCRLKQTRMRTLHNDNNFEWNYFSQVWDVPAEGEIRIRISAERKSPGIIYEKSKPRVSMIVTFLCSHVRVLELYRWLHAINDAWLFARVSWITCIMLLNAINECMHCNIVYGFAIYCTNAWFTKNIGKCTLEHLFLFKMVFPCRGRFPSPTIFLASPIDTASWLTEWISF